MQLTVKQKLHLAEFGYVKLEGVVPQVMVEEARRSINRALDPGHANPKEELQRLQRSEEIVGLYHKTPAADLAGSVIDASQLQPITSAQIALRMPLSQYPLRSLLPLDRPAHQGGEVAGFDDRFVDALAGHAAICALSGDPMELTAAKGRTLGRRVRRDPRLEPEFVPELVPGTGTGAPVLKTLYERPYLFQLAEAGNWDEMERRIRTVFQELSRYAHSAEHRMEVYAVFYGAFSHSAHLSGRLLFDVLGEEHSPGLWLHLSVEQLQRWVQHAAQLLKETPDRDQERCWDEIVRQVQIYVQRHLSEDVSLQTLADRVYLHPVYLSKLYRARTGERLIDYIVRIKMEHAAEQLIRRRSCKIYEAARMVGYYSSSYFCKTFKNHFGVTPAEYRKRQNSMP